MSGPLDFLINHLVMNITSVRDAAALSTGTCTWEFSQCLDPVRSVIGKSSTTKNGICEILAAKWICEASKGHSLRAWLTSGGLVVDLAKVSLLAQVFGTGKINQENATEAWMRTNGIPPRANLLDMGGSEYSGVKFDPVADLLGDFKLRYEKPAVLKPLYALIMICERNRILGYKGHIMAIKAEPINGGAFLYFDPNFGEFRFTTWAGFETWFAYCFRTAHYAKFMGTGYGLRYF